MERQFNTALQASQIVDELYKEMKRFRYNADLRRMHKNIEKMVNELGKAEVLVRQTHKDAKFLQQKQQVIEAIDRFEKLLLVMALTE
jgi:hypothetical protein